MNLRQIDAGRVLLGDRDLTHATPAQHRQAGLAYIPADWRGVGSIGDLSIAENAILGSHRKRARCAALFRRERAIRTHAGNLVARFGVRTPGIGFAAGKLSGGNLQKLVLGREVMCDPAALVVEQPTRGLDVGAIETVWGELLAERGKGKAILLISAELDEVLNLADRIAVMFEGRLMAVIDAADATIEALGLMMAGRTVPTEPRAEWRMTHVANA